MIKHIIDIIYGMIIGIANIIPGVSGGTMALVMGFYERLISTVNNISGDTIKSFLKVVTFKKENIEALKQEIEKIDLMFLMKIIIGAVLSNFALAKLMPWLLQTHHDPTYGFFFGLVLLSIVAPFRLIKKKNIAAFLMIIIAASAVVVVNEGVSGDKLIERAKTKHELKLKKEAAEAKGEKYRETSKIDIAKLGWTALLGAISISAMILPGISGSFLLLLMGGYIYIILKSVSSFDLPVIGAFAVGCVIGLIFFSRFLNFLLKKWHDMTMAFLAGLVAGSLWAIWPFKTSTIVGDTTVYLTNTLPESLSGGAILTLITALTGAAIVGFMLYIETKSGKESAK